LFDGPHTQTDQYDGIILPLIAMQDQFVLIVDDYNVEHIRKGTEIALKDQGLRVQCSIEILTDKNANPVIHWQNSDWHNGYFIAVVCKP
jgi:hypothetical protein